jgi:pimeloyl-ACP methyl ester carboxylesterase
MIPHLFTRDGRKLFGLHFEAEARRREFALVFCNAFGKEYEICRTQVAQFARALTRRGIGAYRFDYYGYGDSEGEFQEASFSTMCSDLDAAIDEAKRRCGVEKVVLAGIRFGALVAEACSTRRSDVTQLVMWAPTLEPWSYFYEGLRQTVSMQTTLFRTIKITREQIVENVLAGRPSLVDGCDFNFTDEGFRLGAQLVRELRTLSPAAYAERVHVPTLLAHVVKKPTPPPAPILQHRDIIAARGVPCSVETVVEAALPWVHENVFAAESPKLFATTLRWLGV